eukprot:scaffold22852_cov63-Attheya_sp.AAC.3
MKEGRQTAIIGGSPNKAQVWRRGWEGRGTVSAGQEAPGGGREHKRETSSSLPVVGMEQDRQRGVEVNA